MTRRSTRPDGGSKPTSTVDGETVTIVSAYVPTGEVGTAKQDAKWAFLDAMEKRMPLLRRERPLSLIMGDLNVGHRELDIRNWKGNVKKAGFLPRERAYFDRFLGADGSEVTGVDGSTGPGLGWVDVGRRATMATSTGRTRGGRAGARRSTPTPAGASTTTSRRPSSRVASPTTGWCARPRGTPGGAITRRSWRITPSASDPVLGAWPLGGRDGGLGIPPS